MRSKIVKLTPEQVEALMVPKLIEAMYPVLIPIEQQDVHIQNNNREKVARAAQAAWQAFISR